MLQNINLRKLLYLILIPLGILISLIASKFPYIVEALYSSSFYKIFISALSRITGIFPFSLGELIVIATLCYLIFNIALLVLLIFSSQEKKLSTAINKLINGIVFAAIAYFIFLAIWGINYHRLPFSELTGMNINNPTKEELKQVCLILISKTNELRTEINEADDGTALLMKKNNSQIAGVASLGYTNAAKIYTFLGGSYGIPKGVYFSTFLSYLGISGIYFPFTAEANYNTSIPSSMLPCTISHEMAHQRGFAREDEANYIAYITCKLHPQVEFQYSGMLLALIHSMNALYDNDPDEFTTIKKMYSVGVSRDIQQLSDYWKQFEGPTERLQNKINDAYLKSNLQQEGVESYGRMVDLLIAEYRQSK